MATKVTYLLGAGASAQTIPTVAAFGGKIKELIERLRSGLPIETIDTYDDNGNSSSVQQQLADYASFVLQELKNFSSVDTYARYLYFTNLPELPKLKALINFCFSYWQHVEGLDKRYDSLFSLVVKGQTQQPILPNNIRIVTWNYDLQLESCVSRYFQYPDLEFFDQEINLFPSVRKKLLSEKSGFSIFKLNGSAQTYFHVGKISKSRFPLSFFNKELLSTKEKSELSLNLNFHLKQFYLSASSFPQMHPVISYSWEKEPQMEIVRKLCFDTCSDTEILVIIGYSFPLINREVDEELFREMRLLNKIIIQSPKKTIQGVRERCIGFLNHQNNPQIFTTGPYGDYFDSVAQDQIISIESTNEFYVPDEIFDI